MARLILSAFFPLTYFTCNDILHLGDCISEVRTNVVSMPKESSSKLPLLIANVLLLLHEHANKTIISITTKYFILKNLMTKIQNIYIHLYVYKSFFTQIT